MYSTPGMFVVRADAAYRRSTISRAGRSRSGRAGSGLVILARYVLDGLGLDLERDFQAVYLDARATARPWSWTARPPRCGAAASAGPASPRWREAPAGARFIAPDLDGIRRIQAKHPFLKPMTVPAGPYPGRRPTSSRWARGAL